jgi:hypothetical protein
MASQAIRNPVDVVALEELNGALSRPRWAEIAILVEDIFGLLIASRPDDMQ